MRRLPEPRAVRPPGGASAPSGAVPPDESVTEPIEPLMAPVETGAPERDAPERDAVREAPGAALEDAGSELTQRDLWRAARARRRALKTEIRRFTQRSRRRRMLWLGVLGALVLLVGGSAAAAYSPLFAVERITVVGASTLDPEAVEAALADQLGTPLALVDDSEVKAALIAFPLIETYTLEANPPHDLTVRIVERTPVGVIETDAGFSLVDAAGVVLSTTDARPEGQPVLDITGGTGSDAFVEAGLVVRSLPADLRSALTAVRASTPDDVTLMLGDVTVMWGSAEKSPEKARTLGYLLEQHPKARDFDVSAPNAVTFS